ncbi:hypothetical protein DFR67_10813 [Williamsia limnetica]|jgi:hypothetical protein|uniref:DUF3263 domain-containing protein n=1 Tax=Williamsia limnetica TaxID=882452 RepID=A0A318RN50_WILLI|nr:hypothetical protein [Williamsia limnetica]PYE16262.1 hypothetical protein DFR67_10813 [Williamsia limnetica]
MYASTRIQQHIARWTPDRYDTAMIEFALQWQYFGGGDAAEIFETFGLPERHYFQRLLGWMSADGVPGVDDDARCRITEVCHRRLAA